MTKHDNMLDREAVRTVIQQWNANRLDLFALSEPDENLLFHGVMRFYFQDAGQKVATKCIRVASDATVADVIDTLIEKFRPDMRMLSVPNYALYEVHANGEEKRLNPDEKPLLVQLNWHIDDREGRFLLKNIDQKTTPIEATDMHFKRKLSKREKKEQRKKDKQTKHNCEPLESAENETPVSTKLYTELPETSFTRSISNPEAVMRRRRQQKLEKKLQQFRSRDGGPDTGGTLKIYGESLCQDVPYKTLLLSIRDCAQAVVREMLSKYGLEKTDPMHHCLVQVNCDGTEYILDDDECPLSILMNHPTSRGSIMFHVRRRPADSQPRRRKKKPIGSSSGSNSATSDREGPVLVEVTHSGDVGRRIKLGNDPIEVGSASTNSLQLFGPSIQARHCLVSLLEGVCTVTPLHADALTFVNGHHITQPTILHNGSVVMFGRVASYRFLDSPSDGRYNLALSQSQLDSACLYESRSPTSLCTNKDGNISTNQKRDFDTTNLSGGINDDKRSQTSNKTIPDQLLTNIKETEINFDTTETSLDSETKSISSIKSSGSTNPDQRSRKMVSGLGNQGHEPILPAVLEFPETHQENFLCQILTELDVNLPNFKLAPVYTLYLCARYRASTHYRPDLQPTERAHKLTIFLHHVASLIFSIVQGHTDPRVLAFWMANSSELLHFLKSDRHISAFSIQAQEILAESVQTAFRNLVNSFRAELCQSLNQFLSETIDHDSAAGLVLAVLGSAMALLRRCRVNAALTIQLFSQLFHYINVISFNSIVANSHMSSAEFGKMLSERLQQLELWAERQGLELAADCHLAKINQCAQFLQASKTSVEEVQKLACSCFRLNSLQMSALLQHEQIPRTLKDTVIRMAESVADELTRADGREIRLEESPELHLALLLPDDGFSCDVVRGIPSGLVDFLNPLQSAGMCRLAAQPSSIGLWTVYMHQYNLLSPSEMSNKLPQPEIQIIKLQKNSNGMGLSIVAAKGAGQERLGIYIKSVVQGGAADVDGRLQAGDQLLRVDGQSLIGITQERAADYLVRTGPIVTLEVAKQGAIYHGLATLLQQPSPVMQRGNRLSEREVSVIEVETKNTDTTFKGSQLVPSKSVPVLHHSNKNVSNKSNSKSQSTYSLSNSTEQGFYQNLSIYRAQNQSQPIFGERLQTVSSAGSPYTGIITNPIQQQTPLITTSGTGSANVKSRPTSTHYHNGMNANLNRSPDTTQYFSSILTNDNLAKSTSFVNITENACTGSSLNQQNQHPQSSLSAEVRSKNKKSSNNDGQSLNSFRMNQIFAPSMPNITAAHATSLVQNSFNNSLLSSQSMQNVSIISQSTNRIDTPQPLTLVNRQHIAKPTNIPANSGERFIMKSHGLETGEDIQNQTNQQLQIQEQHYPNVSILPLHRQVLKQNDDTYSLSSSQQTHSQNVNRPQSKWVPMSSEKRQNTEETPPLPPTTTHPLFLSNSQNSQELNFCVSSSEPTNGNTYPTSTTVVHHGNFTNTNPWDREIKEKEHKKRREHMRFWRDQQITELSSLLKRSSQQDEQLKTLVLEKEFEKRVLEVKDHEDDCEMSFQKENDQDRVQQVLNSKCSVSQSEIRTQTIETLENTDNTIISNLMNENGVSFGHNYPSQQTQAALAVQPKSILKNNRYDCSATFISPTLPSKAIKSASFADETSLQLELPISNITKNDFNVKLNSETNSSGIEVASEENLIQHSSNSLAAKLIFPPSPPERNSSYIIMSQQQQKVNNSNQNSSKTMYPLADPTSQNNVSIYPNGTSIKKSSFVTSINNNHLILGPQGMGLNESLLISARDSKRVSFHDDEDNYIPSQSQSFGAEDLSSVSEAFQIPTTPETDLWNSTVHSTPGVIGAQEVYRDPRQRRLAEQQEKQLLKTSDSVPEKLSFKEKMKMFAIESGEDHTPRDKLKISRAQRDIDAAN